MDLCLKKIPAKESAADCSVILGLFHACFARSFLAQPGGLRGVAVADAQPSEKAGSHVRVLYGGCHKYYET